MKNMILSIFILSFLTLQSCVRPAPCNGCGNGGSGNNGNGYNGSQLYVGDMITGNILAYPNSSTNIPLDIDFNGSADYSGYTADNNTLLDIRYEWNNYNRATVMGTVAKVNPFVDIRISGVMSGSNKTDGEETFEMKNATEGQEIELKGELYTVCIVTEDAQGKTLPGNLRLTVLRLKSKIKELQNLDDEK